jgi:hypothetical protein
MKRCHVLHGHGDLRLMASMPPPASGLCLRGDVSLHAIGPPHSPFGDPGHLWLYAKHDGYSFCVSKGITNMKTQLAEVPVDTLYEDVKALPQQRSNFMHSLERHA